MLNDLSIHPYVWVPQWTTESVRIAVERACAAGFNRVVVPLSNQEAIDPPAIAGVFGEYGLSPVNTSNQRLDADVSSIEEEDPLEAIDASLPHPAYFEVDENHRGLPDRGAIDFAPMLARLFQANYTGPIGVPDRGYPSRRGRGHGPLAQHVRRWRLGHPRRCLDRSQRISRIRFPPVSGRATCPERPTQ